MAAADRTSTSSALQFCSILTTSWRCDSLRLWNQVCIDRGHLTIEDGIGHKDVMLASLALGMD